ncbi:MAG: tetraacyldisaccharide 4'-kinase [Burkholderiales bacterium]|nr:MAG: tetraacyldisaccharide 4'-kinase [Burkholderiales bacterium]
MNSTVRWIERHWRRTPWLAAPLVPLSLLFGAAAAARRALYRAGIFKTERLPVPVIVVGNLTVGGTGKTPFVIWLVQRLRGLGWRPGIVSRGYGATVAGPAPVEAASDPARFGDEPVLLARRTGCPVWIGRDRVGAARALLAERPECDVIVSDDGLQHYRLARDVEIAVVDGDQGFGNGWLLPAGPLREDPSRLDRVDLVIVHGNAPRAFAPGREYRMRLEGRQFYNLLNPRFVVPPGHFQGKRTHAVAGIGNPRRFFDALKALGLSGTAHAFPDHHRFRAEELRFAGAEAILMTEKDAIKCEAFADETHWVLAVTAVVDPDPLPALLAKIGYPHGSQAA